MTPPEFSVLLLAWDDADPSVAVLGGSALPPTLPLVYQLAAQHPVLAVYPHLPAAKAPAYSLPTALPAIPKTQKAQAAATAETPENTPDALETAVAMPGVRLLPAPAAALAIPATAGAFPALTSRLVGLHDLPRAGSTQLLGALRPGAPTTRPLPATASRSQWPTGAHAPLATRWLAPRRAIRGC